MNTSFKKVRCLFFIAVFLFVNGTSLSYANSFSESLDTIQTNEEKIDYIADEITKLIFIDPNKATQFAELADSIIQHIEDPFYDVKLLSIQGITSFGNEDFDQAISAYLEVFRLLENYDDDEFKAKTQNNLAAVYQASGDIDGCIEYFNKALVYFEGKRDTLWMAHLNNNLAIQHMNVKEYETSDIHFKKSKSYYDHVGLALYQGITALNYGNLKIEMKSYQQAESLYKEAQFLVEEKSHILLHAASNGGLAIAAKELGRYGEAERLATLSIEQSKEINHLEQEKSSLETLVEIHEKSEKFKDAMRVQKVLNVVSDSLYQQQQDQQLSDALKKYETAEKEKEIAILNSDNEIAAIRLSNFQRAFFLSLFGLAVFLGLVFYLVRFNRTINKQNNLISKTLDEKEILLKEIHHRVKNNLQVISSLLDLQSRRIDDDTAKSALTVGKNRVQSMALIHQNLYQEDDLTGINVKEYLTKLSSNLFDAYNIQDDKIKLHIEVSDVIIDVDTMIPLGLIINELMSNILKHAFVGRQHGTIIIKLEEDQGELLLSIADDGVGISKSVNINGGSFGYQLIHALAEQISGVLNIDINKGTIVSLRIMDFKKVA